MINRVMKDNSLIFDAHVHFPMKADDPYETLRIEINRVKAKRILLIVNNESEAEIFWKKERQIVEGNLGASVNIAFILDCNNKKWRCNFDKIEERGWNYAVKIHPRLSNISFSQFEMILDKVNDLNCNTIIIDNWIYGPRIENHIGTELTIYLSEHLTDKKIVMAHSGGVKLLETMLITRPLENVFYDLSETCTFFANTSVQLDIVHFLKWSKDRVVFGSDYPSFSINECVYMLNQDMKEAGYSREDINDVMYYNACKIFGNCISQ